MMAFDRTPPRASLTPATSEALRRVLAQAVRDGDHTEELGEVLGRVAREAHAVSMTPEQLLVQLKDLWYDLPELRSLHDQSVESRLLQQLVARCIKEYYRS